MTNQNIKYCDSLFNHSKDDNVKQENVDKMYKMTKNEFFAQRGLYELFGIRHYGEEGLVHPHLDIDVKKEKCVNFDELVPDNVLKVACDAFEKEFDVKNPSVQQSFYPDKISFHVIYADYVVNYKDFCSVMKNQLKQKLQPLHIDFDIYHPTEQLFRMVNTCKIDVSKKRKPSPLVPKNFKGNPQKHFVTYITGDEKKIELNVTSNVKSSESKTQSKKQSTTQPKTEVSTTTIDNDIVTLLNMLDKKRFENHNDWIAIGWSLFSCSSEYKNLFIQYTEKNYPKYSEGSSKRNIHTFWNDAHKYSESYSIGTLKHFAKTDSPDLYHQEFIVKKQSYEEVKKEFESQVSKIKYTQMFVVEGKNDSDIFLSQKGLYHAYNNKYCYYPTVDKKNETVLKHEKFIPKWLDDIHIREYNNVDFLPYPKKCDEKTYNLFKGLAIEKVEVENVTNFDLITNHIKYLCGDDDDCYNYFIKWLAHIVQKPGEIAKTAVVLKSGQGAGKNMFLNWFGNSIIGKQWFFSSADAEQLFGRFAVGKKNKLLINLDETSAKDTYKYSEVIKNLITAEKITYEQKGLDTIEVQNYARWVFTTNNHTPVKIEMNDRRFVVFECQDDKNNNKEYFDELAIAMNNKDITKSFYLFLMSVEVEEFDFINERPLNDSYKDVKQANIPAIVYFLDYWLQTSTYENQSFIQTNLFFKQYMTWRSEYHNSDSSSNMTLNRFSREINRGYGFERYRNMKERGFNFDYENVQKKIDSILN